MAERANKPVSDCSEELSADGTLREQLMDWVRTELAWYAGSFSIHLLALSALLLLPSVVGPRNQDDTPQFASMPKEDPQLKPPDTAPLDTGVIDEVPPPDLKIETNLNVSVPNVKADVVKPVEPLEGGDMHGRPDVASSENSATSFGPGPKILETQGFNTGPTDGQGTADHPGAGGKGGFELGLVKKRRDHTGIPPTSERAVTAALNWLARHQDYDGHWSLANYTLQCKPADKTCTGKGEILADAGATAMGLLPFLAAGHTHKSPGRYKDNIRRGIDWLIRHQQPDGNLAAGAQQMMYSHGLATIALCEVYGLTADREVGRAAQGAVNFILSAQGADGGWRYNPKEAGDTSVVGWQLMALKSAHMAGLDVGGSAFSGTSKWLDSVSVHDGAEYAYQPGLASTPTMTSVGLLCRQYLGAKRSDPILTGGMAYLQNHMPDEGFSNIYYWYYATQVMHNMYGSEWDEWNRKMRTILVHAQVRGTDQCSNGSWSPENDAWGRRGGRLMQTSLSCLTLEVYYRYLPLFKSETGGELAAGR
jgi:hypothetical protein